MIHASGINTIYTNVNIQPTQSILLEHTSCHTTFPFHLANHNKDAAINILIIFISIGLIIFNVNYFHTTIVKNEQIINQPTNAFQSEFSLAALWRNENHAGVKDANPVAVNQENT